MLSYLNMTLLKHTTGALLPGLLVVFACMDMQLYGMEAIGISELTLREDMLSLPANPARHLDQDLLMSHTPTLADSSRGWGLENIGFAVFDELLPDAEDLRMRELGGTPAIWPGMLVDIDYHAVAAASRRRIPAGATALAAAGLMLLASRKW